MPQIMLMTVFNPPAVLGTSGTGPQKVTGASQLLNLTTASIRCFLPISTTWPRNHRLCACLRRCWTRFFDLRMHRLSLLRISLVFKQGSVSSCRIARVKRRNCTNQCVLLGALIRLSLLGSLIPICPQANQAALPPRRSQSSSKLLSRRMSFDRGTKWCFHVLLLSCVLVGCAWLCWIGTCGVPYLSLRHGYR